MQLFDPGNKLFIKIFIVDSKIRFLKMSFNQRNRKQLFIEVFSFYEIYIIIWLRKICYITD